MHLVPLMALFLCLLNKEPCAFILQWAPQSTELPSTRGTFVTFLKQSREEEQSVTRLSHASEAVGRLCRQVRHKPWGQEICCRVFGVTRMHTGTWKSHRAGAEDASETDSLTVEPVLTHRLCSRGREHLAGAVSPPSTSSPECSALRNKGDNNVS